MTAHMLQFRHEGVLRQMIRFGVAGGLSSVVYALVYLPLTTYVFAPEHAVAAVPVAFVVAVIFGFFAHSRWSFRGHGVRSTGIGQYVRFAGAQAAGLVINALVTWIGTAVLDFPAWAPLVPAVLLAAVVTFILNRRWVFG